MVVKAPPPPPPAPVYSWTGFYVGGNAGGVWGQVDESLGLTGSWVGRPETPALLNAGSQGLRGSGFIGGGQVGFNVQSGPAVFGIEADIDSGRMLASKPISNVPNPSVTSYSIGADARTSWMATVRGRAGVAFDRLLLYVTGGLAVANDNFSQTLVQTTGGAFVQTGSPSATKDVGIFGGGVEYAFGNGWSLKGEYLHADLGRLAANSVCPVPSTGCGGFTGNHSDKLRIDIARAGINYKFDWGKAPTPVVAKY
jgi:outer membrane immunogenic protein